MVASKTPTIAKIRNEVSEADIRALLTIAVGEVCDFLNVGKNMNDAQIALTVDLIIEQFWYFKLEEIKYCFRRAMMREKLFDRLDGNIIIGWLREYDSERTDVAISISEKEDAEALSRRGISDDGAISLDQYIERLEAEAITDRSASERLNFIKKMIGCHINEDIDKKNKDFKEWKKNLQIGKN